METVLNSCAHLPMRYLCNPQRYRSLTRFGSSERFRVRGESLPARTQQVFTSKRFSLISDSFSRQEAGATERNQAKMTLKLFDQAGSHLPLLHFAPWTLKLRQRKPGLIL